MEMLTFTPSISVSSSRRLQGVAATSGPAFLCPHAYRHISSQKQTPSSRQAQKSSPRQRAVPGMDLTERLSVTMKDGFPLMFWRMLGTWEGRYVVMNPLEGTVSDGGTTGTFENTAEGNNYSQRNTYTDDKGSAVTRDFFGLYVDGVVKIDSLRVKGILRFLDDSTAVLNAFLKADEAQFVETWRLLDQDHRTRTWHVYRNGQCTKIIHAQEERISADYTYFENDGQIELDFS